MGLMSSSSLIARPFLTALLGAGCSLASLASCSLDHRLALADTEHVTPWTSMYQLTAEPTASTLGENRERLLSTYASRQGEGTCETWNAMTREQQGVFLTTTDLLGKRVFIDNGPDARPDEGQLMVLDRVTKIYAVRGASAPGKCGGGEFNRLFFGVDRELMDRIRNYDSGLPMFGRSRDLMGPHDPFNGSRETKHGQPTGQLHFWKWDRVCTDEITAGCNEGRNTMTLQRSGVEGVDEPWIVELDLDYNLPHDSNPECTYGGSTGREKYEKKWWYKGKAWQPGAEGAGNAELDWRPSGC